MNEDEVWAAIDTQRLRTVDLLESLSAEAGHTLHSATARRSATSPLT